MRVYYNYDRIKTDRQGNVYCLSKLNRGAYQTWIRTLLISSAGNHDSRRQKSGRGVNEQVQVTRVRASGEHEAMTWDCDECYSQKQLCEDCESKDCHSCKNMKELLFNSSIIAYATENNKRIVCNNGHTIFTPEETCGTEGCKII